MPDVTVEFSQRTTFSGNTPGTAITVSTFQKQHDQTGSLSAENPEQHRHPFPAHRSQRRQFRP